MDYMLYEHIHRRRKEEVKGFKLSTAGRNIKQLRIFLINRMRKKIIPFIDLTDFKILDEECDAIYIWLQLKSIAYTPWTYQKSHGLKNIGTCLYRDV